VKDCAALFAERWRNPSRECRTTARSGLQLVDWEQELVRETFKLGVHNFSRTMSGFIGCSSFLGRATELDALSLDRPRSAPRC
jgi:hypothetical protein